MKKLLILDLTSLLVSEYGENMPKGYKRGLVGSERDKILKELVKNSKGEYIGAVRGLSHILLDAIDRINPTHIVGVWGTSRKNNSRKEIYSEYKNDESVMDEPLREQFETAKTFLHPLIKQYTSNRYEAMDLAGTLASHFKDDAKVYILCRNKNYLQLADMATIMLKSKYSKVVQTEESKNLSPEDFYEYTGDIVRSEYGFAPQGIADYNALIGSKSVGIPGVKGIGVVTATALIKGYGSIESIYDNISEIGTEEFKANLKSRFSILRTGSLFDEHEKNNAFISKKLCTIKTDVFNVNEVVKESENKIMRKTVIRQLYNLGVLPSWVSEQSSDRLHLIKLCDLIETNDDLIGKSFDMPDFLGGNAAEEVIVYERAPLTFVGEDSACYELKTEQGEGYYEVDEECFDESDYFDEDNLLNNDYNEYDSMESSLDECECLVEGYNATITRASNINEYHCSVCGEDFNLLGYKTPKFCVECGVPIRLQIDNLEDTGSSLEEIRRKTDLEHRLVI